MKRWLSIIVFAFAGGCLAGGDPEAGRDIALDPARGNCAICHQLLPESKQQQGNVGPPLLNVGSRLTQEQIRQRVEDARRVNPDTLMPPYGSTKNLHRVAKEYRGEPILTEDEISDVVAWLKTLKGDGQ